MDQTYSLRAAYLHHLDHGLPARYAFDVYRFALVVVRPELIDAAIARWPWVSEIYDRDLP